MLDLVAGFSSKNDNKFNDELLCGIRNNDDMVSYIDESCRAVAKLLPENIKYLGHSEIDNRKRMLERDALDKDPKGSKKAKNEIRINISYSYAKEVSFNFEIHFGGQVMNTNFTLWIPLLIDNAHFFIRGNKYSAPIQIVDAISYTQKNMLVLKTLTRALKYERSKCIISDIYGKKYNVEKICILLTKKPIPLLVYFFAAYGFFNTIEYFGANQYIKVYSGDPKESIPKNKYLFKFGNNLYLGVDIEEFDTNRVLRTFVGTLIASTKRTMDMDYIRNPVRWLGYLGETISQAKSLEKGQSMLKTFMNILDTATVRNIHDLVDGETRDNMFKVARWIFINYTQMCSKDDGLQNKRLRLNEYLISPFTKIFVDKVHRFMNTPDKIKTINTLQDIFKIKSSIILNAIIGKINPQVTGLNIQKYSSESSDDTLVNVRLVSTKGGPGSPLEKTKRVGIKHREFSIDSLGNLDIIAGTSASAPGIARYICPMCDTYNPEKKIFEIDPNLMVM